MSQLGNNLFILFNFLMLGFKLLHLCITLSPRYFSAIPGKLRSWQYPVFKSQGTHLKFRSIVNDLRENNSIGLHDWPVNTNISLILHDSLKAIHPICNALSVITNYDFKNIWNISSSSVTLADHKAKLLENSAWNSRVSAG